VKAGLIAFSLALAAAAAAPAAAQVHPQPGPGDPRIQTVDYSPDQVVALTGAPGYQLTVEFGPDEQIENVAVGDSAAWQVTPNRRGDHLFVKPLQAGVSTNMTVVTSVRVYLFELSPLYGPSSDMAYTVRFHYPGTDSAAADPAPVGAVEGRYRVSGARELRPSRIGDDGTHTYIQWPAESAIPAVYALNDAGQEALVNGAMREDMFVIDAVVPRLVFRIDQHVARADRVNPGRSR
jgi:type IV secretion system protein VirB9